MSNAVRGALILATLFGDAVAAPVPPAVLSKRKFTAVKVEIAKPTGDPVVAGSVDNEFVFKEAEGIATIPVEAAITPTSLAESVGETIRWTFVSIPAGSVLTWVPSWPDNPSAGKGRTATATLKGYPANNSEFGPRTIRMEVVRGTKVVKTRTAKIELFFKHDASPTGRASPNWFFYWNQTPAGRSNAIWGAPQDGIGEVPAGKFWTTYAGPRNRIVIGGGASGAYTRRDGSGEPASGIAMFANVIAHEGRHVQQIVDSNSVPFYSGVTGVLREAPCAGWSFGIPNGTPTLCNGSVVTPWNHFTDKDSNGVFNAGDTPLDADSSDLADSFDPTAADRAKCAAPGNAIECQAQLAETIDDDDFAGVDWADNGKQHH